MLCAKSNRAVRVMWRCYKPAYIFYKVIQKEVTIGIFNFGIVVWQRNYIVWKEKQDIQRTLYGVSMGIASVSSLFSLFWAKLN